MTFVDNFAKKKGDVKQWQIPIGFTNKTPDHKHPAQSRSNETILRLHISYKCKISSPIITWPWKKTYLAIL